MVARVYGRVQGVGFRAWTRRRLAELGLDGSAVNLADGTVEVAAVGDRRDLELVVAALRGRRTPGEVARVDVSWDEDVR
jgi:acylphosphatase